MDRPSFNLQSSDPEACYQNCRLVCTEAIFTTDSQGILTSYNQGTRELLGYTPAAIIGKPLRDFLKGGNDEFQRFRETLETSDGVISGSLGGLSTISYLIPRRLKSGLWVKTRSWGILPIGR